MADTETMKENMKKSRESRGAEIRRAEVRPD